MTICKTKSVVIPIGDIKEDGYHLSLNSLIQFQFHGNSKNVSLVSALRTCRKTVSISQVLDNVLN